MKPGMTQRELEAELHAHFGGAREPVEPPSLGDVMRTLPDDPKLRRRGLSGRPAIVALAAVVLLVGGALGLPFLMTGAGAQETPSASAKPSSVADETSTPALSEVPTADATDIVVELPTDMPSVGIIIDSTPAPTEAPGGGGSGWWSSIVVTAATKAQSGGEGWVEVTTHGPTQCELLVYYSSALTQNLGGFGAPSNSPRRDTYSVPDDFTGTAYPKVSCWRDGPESGPKHTWTLTVTVTQGPSPAPLWTLTASSAPGRAGGTLSVRFRTSESVHCTLRVTLPDGTLDGETDVPTVADTSESFDISLPADTRPGTGPYTVNCTDMNENVVSASGTVKVLAAATPPPATAAPTAKLTAPPTAKATDKPTPTHAPSANPTT